LTCEGFTKYGILKFLGHVYDMHFICILWVCVAEATSLSKVALYGDLSLAESILCCGKHPSVILDMGIIIITDSNDKMFYNY